MLSRALLSLLLPALGCASLAQAQEPPPVQVLGPHWIALRFSPQYPHGRHTQNPLPGSSLALPLPDSLMIKGQAGQSSDNAANTAEFRIPVPDYAADATVDRAVLLATMTATGATAPVLDGVHSAPGDCPKGLCSQAGIGNTGVAFVAEIKNPVNPAEFTVEFSVKPGQTLALMGGVDPRSPGSSVPMPTLLLHTREAMAEPAGYISAEQSGLRMPVLAPLFDQFLRDTSICLAPDGFYYMTGTTGGPEMMVVTSDLSVWKSPDLVHWSPVRDHPRQSTVVWNIDRDGTWMKPITLRDGEPFRPLWAPEIHYINNTFWIPFSVPRHGITLLKSTTGKAEGPYEIAIKPDQPLSDGIDASLFQDDDGTVYSLYGGGWIARMKPDMSGLAEPYHHLASASGREIGFEGVYLFKDHGRYYLSAADFVLGEYNTYIASATSLAGPWSERYLAVPHAGHGNFFRDKNGRMWSTFFGNDRNSPFHAEPGIVPMLQDAKGRWRPDPSYAAPKTPAATETSIQVPGAIGPSNGQPQHVGVMPVTAARKP